MGTEYFGVCRDCKKFIDLHTFYIIISGDPPSDENMGNSFKGWDFNKYGYWISRLFWFLDHHKGHRFGIYSEHECDERELGDIVNRECNTGQTNTEELPYKDNLPED